jgi:hypothetical protein
MSDRYKVISINHVYMFITFLFYTFLVLRTLLIYFFSICAGAWQHSRSFVATY